MRTPALLQGVWKYRGFILGSVQREFQSKYRNSLLGAAWTILNPLAMIVVYTIIFSNVMGSRMAGNSSAFAYSIHLCAGLLTWGLFAEITSRGQNVFIENANLIKKLSFPRICLPIIVVFNALVNFSIIFGLFTVFLVVTGQFPGWAFAALAPVLLAQIVFAIGLGMVLGVLNVFFRDVGQFFAILLQFWFWFTPIVYVADVLPPAIRQLLMWNPMAAVVVAHQGIILEARMPAWSTLLPVCLLGLLFCAFGMRLFRKRSGEMVDEL
jgi:lipopolysaccharide transport system permease protein